MQVQGVFYDGNNSAGHPARLELDAGGVIFIHYAQITITVDALLLKVSPRVGNTARYLYLADGGVFESADNASLDQLQTMLPAQGAQRYLHRLESNLGWILATAVVMVLVVTLSFTYGIPWAAKTIARMLPQQVHQFVGDQALESLDRVWLADTVLPQETQQRLQERFQAFLQEQQAQGYGVRVEFRASEALGANALALPNGVVIFTDDLVELAQSDDELVAILAHEIGHVLQRHSLQGVVQSSLAFWFVVAMTGDLSSASESIAALPAVLIDLSYSRDMEREADQFALAFLQRHAIDPIHFANIMQRLHQDLGVEEQGKEKEDEHFDQKGSGDQRDGLLGFLSTHPRAHERMEVFREASK